MIICYLLLTAAHSSVFNGLVGMLLATLSLSVGRHGRIFIIRQVFFLHMHYFRSHSIPCSLYIDDRHTGELCIPFQSSVYEKLPNLERSFASASSAIFIVCYTLVVLGYFLGLRKSNFLPRQAVPYLGFMVDSVKEAFLLLQDKKQKFCDLIRLILGSDSLDLLKRPCNGFLESALLLPRQSQVHLCSQTRLI